MRHPSVFRHFKSERGFSLIEMLAVVTIIAIVAGVAVAMTPSMLRTARGSAGAEQVEAFLRRTRENAISQRRNIRIRFIAPNLMESARIRVPGVAEPAFTVIETVPLEGRIEFRQFGGVPDTPAGFGNVAPVTVGGAAFDAFPNAPVMFTSEGVFADANGFPVNLSVFLGVSNQVDTAGAVAVLGATAAIASFRWDGRQWQD